jgi:hypothetical protein
MTWDCERCGTSITDADVRYTKHETDDKATYCSVNCIADVDHVDETQARNQLFADPLEA